MQTVLEFMCSYYCVLFIQSIYADCLFFGRVCIRATEDVEQPKPMLVRLDIVASFGLLEGMLERRWLHNRFTLYGGGGD